MDVEGWLKKGSKSTQLTILQIVLFLEGGINILLGVLATIPMGYSKDYYFIYFGYMWVIGAIFLFISSFLLKKKIEIALVSILIFYLSFTIGFSIGINGETLLPHPEFIVFLIVPNLVVVMLVLMKSYYILKALNFQS